MNEEWIYNADDTVTVIKDGVVVGTYPQTGGVTPNPGQPGTGYTTGGKKWWETAIGALPAILGGIFGNTGQTNPGTPYPTTPNQTNTGLGGSTMILLIGGAAIVLILLMNKKK